MVLGLLLQQGGKIITDAEQEAAHVERAVPVFQALPAADLILGGIMLILIVVFHGVCLRLITAHVLRRTKAVALKPSEWRADLILAGTILLLLALHLTETAVWTTVLVKSHLVSSWRDAGLYAANTYTTLGYGSVLLPPAWQMLAPIIAISGLFTFGWTGSVLVDIVARVNRLKDLAEGTQPPA